MKILTSRKKSYLKVILLALVFSNNPVSTKACTIFSCALKGEVWAAGNEDHDTPFTKVWFIPASEDRYGAVYFGFSDMHEQAGMNEHGLFFDYAAIGYEQSELSKERPIYMADALSKCKNVEEVKEYLGKNNIYIVGTQLFVSDAHGGSFVTSGNTIYDKKETYQIATNFNVCHAETGNYDCFRYDLLDNELAAVTELTEPFLRTLLNRTHSDGQYKTQYSNVYDLKRKQIYLSRFHIFQESTRIDLARELQKGFHILDIHEMFRTPYFMEELYREEHPDRIVNDMEKQLTKENMVAAKHLFDEYKKKGHGSMPASPVGAMTGAFEASVNVLNQARARQCLSPYNYHISAVDAFFGWRPHPWDHHKLDAAFGLLSHVIHTSQEEKPHSQIYILAGYLKMLLGFPEESLVFFENARKLSKDNKTEMEIVNKMSSYANE